MCAYFLRKPRWLCSAGRLLRREWENLHRKSRGPFGTKRPRLLCHLGVKVIGTFQVSLERPCPEPREGSPWNNIPMQLKWGWQVQHPSDASWPSPQSFVGVPLGELPLSLKNSTIGQRSALALWSGQPQYFKGWLLRSPALWSAAPSEATRASGGFTVLQLSGVCVPAPAMGQGQTGLRLWLLGHIMGGKLMGLASRHLNYTGPAEALLIPQVRT